MCLFNVGNEKSPGAEISLLKSMKIHLGLSHSKDQISSKNLYLEIGTLNLRLSSLWVLMPLKYNESYRPSPRNSTETCPMLEGILLLQLGYMSPKGLCICYLKTSLVIC